MVSQQQIHKLEVRLLRKAQAKARKTKVCPKCHKRKSISKHFGFRTRHDTDGIPLGTQPQSYCTGCRKGTIH